MLKELTAILSDYFEVGSNCYHYILERVKYAELTAKDFREYNEDDVAEIAEYLIDNGVTVQRWIPVTDRLPTAEDALKGHVYAFLKDTKSGGEWPYEAVHNHPDWFSHWMPPSACAQGGGVMIATCKLGEKGCWNDGKFRATSNCMEKVVTNADKIRALDDEKLADYLMQFTDLDCRIGFCQNLPKCEALLDTEEGIPLSMCEKCLLGWLRQPAEVSE